MLRAPRLWCVWGLGDLYLSIIKPGRQNLKSSEAHFKIIEKRFEVRLKPNLKSLQANFKTSEAHFKMNEKRFEVRLKQNLKSLQANSKSSEIHFKTEPQIAPSEFQIVRNAT